MDGARFDAGTISYTDFDTLRADAELYLLNGVIPAGGRGMPQPLVPFAFPLLFPDGTRFELQGVVVSMTGPDSVLIQVQNWTPRHAETVQAMLQSAAARRNTPPETQALTEIPTPPPKRSASQSGATPPPRSQSHSVPPPQPPPPQQQPPQQPHAPQPPQQQRAASQSALGPPPGMRPASGTIEPARPHGPGRPGGFTVSRAESTASAQPPSPPPTVTGTPAAPPPTFTGTPTASTPAAFGDTSSLDAPLNFGPRPGPPANTAPSNPSPRSGSFAAQPPAQPGFSPPGHGAQSNPGYAATQSNPSARSGEFPPAQPGFSPAPSPPGYGAPQSNPGYGATQSHPGYGAAPSNPSARSGEFPPAQPGFSPAPPSPPGHGAQSNPGYVATQSNPGYGAAQSNPGYGTAQSTPTARSGEFSPVQPPASSHPGYGAQSGAAAFPAAQAQGYGFAQSNPGFSPPAYGAAPGNSSQGGQGRAPRGVFVPGTAPGFDPQDRAIELGSSDEGSLELETAASFLTGGPTPSFAPSGLELDTPGRPAPYASGPRAGASQSPYAAPVQPSYAAAPYPAQAQGYGQPYPGAGIDHAPGLSFPDEVPEPPPDEEVIEALEPIPDNEPHHAYAQGYPPQAAWAPPPAPRAPLPAAPPPPPPPPAPEAPKASVRPTGTTARIDRFLKLMGDRGASDLHLSVGRPPIFRLGGRLEPIRYRTLDDTDFKDMVGPMTPPHLWEEYMTTGDIDFAYEVVGLSRFRVNLFRQERGLGAVFRMIPTKLMTIPQLGLPEGINKLITLKNGLVLVTGPTGSGKSTTLSAIINEMNEQRAMHFITIEDPIEFVHPNKRSLMSQREIGPHTRTFSAALRSAVREDPDCILVGEMRDLETISMALNAAETGVLVFGTLHTNSAAKTIDRVINVFPADKQPGIRGTLGAVIKCIVAQQLLRKKGSGRVAAIEVLFGSQALSSMIREGKTHQIPSLIRAGKKDGMVMMDDALRKLIEDDLIEPQAALEKALDKDELRRWLAERGTPGVEAEDGPQAPKTGSTSGTMPAVRASNGAVSQPSLPAATPPPAQARPPQPPRGASISRPQPPPGRPPVK